MVFCWINSVSYFVRRSLMKMKTWQKEDISLIFDDIRLSLIILMTIKFTHTRNSVIVHYFRNINKSICLSIYAAWLKIYFSSSTSSWCQSSMPHYTTKKKKALLLWTIWVPMTDSLPHEILLKFMTQNTLNRFIYSMIKKTKAKVVNSIVRKPAV